MSDVRKRLAELSEEGKENLIGELPHLLLEGGQVKNFCRLLSDYHFIEAKINHPKFGLETLIEDYDLIDEDKLLTHPEHNSEAIKALRLIQKVLWRNAPDLSQDTKQLSWQLSGRLLHFDVPELQKLISQISETKTTCLRCLTPSLKPPIDPLVRILKGHNDSFNAVAVTPDCKFAISASDDSTNKVWD